jgi:hypothetical protein
MCRLDLAPEAPWRCPENCASYSRKMMDAGWVTGSLAQAAAPPDDPHLDENTAALLDSAESIINAAGPEIIADIEHHRFLQRKPKKRRWWWPF